MKKLFAFVVAMVMVLSMRVSAFAVSTSSKSSPDTSDDSSTTTSAAVVKSENLNISYSAQTAPTTTEIAAVAGATAAKTATVAAVVDITPVATASSYTFQVTNVTNKNFVALLHWNGAKWEKVSGAKCDANGNITFAISSFSPFAIITSTTPVSPQTGEMNAVVYASCAIMMAGAAVVLFNKSKKNA